jgi:hypothetical protein
MKSRPKTSLEEDEEEEEEEDEKDEEEEEEEEDATSAPSVSVTPPTGVAATAPQGPPDDEPLAPIFLLFNDEDVDLLADKPPNKAAAIFSFSVSSLGLVGSDDKEEEEEEEDRAVYRAALFWSPAIFGNLLPYRRCPKYCPIFWQYITATAFWGIDPLPVVTLVKSIFL